MSLNQIKKRIDSTRKTAQITKAMQMVSASKYNKMVQTSFIMLLISRPMHYEGHSLSNRLGDPRQWTHPVAKAIRQLPT